MKRIVDLCAGTGAFSLAFSSENIVLANDNEPKSKEIYDLNFNHKLTLGDIHQIDVKNVPDHDILTAGFPCPSFSIGGKRLGFKDERGNIIWKIIDIISSKKPECVVLENVKNILTHDSCKTIDIIIKSINDVGYDVKYSLLNTSKITGIPQNRERVYFICFRKDLNIDFSDIFDIPEKQKKEIGDFLEEEIEDKFYYKPTDKIYEILKKNVIKFNTVYQYRRTYVRQNMNGDCPTLTAVMGTGGHNVPIILDYKGVRKLTPRECFNLQGFPKTYKIHGLANSHLYKLAGNSVTVPVVKELSTRILKLLK